MASFKRIGKVELEPSAFQNISNNINCIDNQQATTKPDLSLKPSANYEQQVPNLHQATSPF